MRTIVTPIDFSRLSINGLHLAVMFANKLPADIKMIHVLKDFSKLEAINKFEDLMKYFEPKMKLGKLTYHIRKGLIYHEIVNQAKYDEPAMIITSTHGSSGFEEFFIGSNAYRVVSTADCPVITTRNGKYSGKIERIVLPIDKTLYSRQKVPIAIEIAKAFNAEVHIIGVTDTLTDESRKTVNAYIHQVEHYMNERGLDTYSIFAPSNNNAKAVMKYAESIKAQLICIMTEQEHTISNILLGSYAQQLVNHSKIPVLTLKPKEPYKAGVSMTGFGT